MDKLQQLQERLLENYTEMKAKWAGWSTDTLIYFAHKIAAVKDAYLYLTREHDFTEQELDRLLQFQSPLEVVADRWWDRMQDRSDFIFALDIAVQDDDALLCYPLRKSEPEKPSVLEKLKSETTHLAAAKPHKKPTKEEEAR